jgi:hypothetical protein
LGLGIGGGIAGVRYLRPVVARTANRVTKGALDVSDAAKVAIPEAATAVTKAAADASAAVKQTASDAQEAMAIGRDLGKVWNWGKRAVGGGVYNLTRPRQTWREMKGAFRAGLRQGQLRKAARAAGRTAEEIEAIKVPYPRVARPAWALEAVLRLRELAAKSESSTAQKIGLAAGLGTAALGVSFLPASAKLAAIQGREILHRAAGKASQVRGLRKVVRPPNVDANRGGRMVADYLDASQAALNRGLHGKLAGAVLRYASENPGSLIAKKIGGDFKVSHYARFRSGPKQALGHWDWEVGELYKNKKLRPGRLEKIQAEMDRGRRAVEQEMNSEMWRRGKSEGEALRHVAANTQNADARAYFDRLAMTKAGVAKQYAKMGALAPGAIMAGGGLAWASRKREGAA